MSQSAVPSKHHKSYGKSFKKFDGGVVGWGGLFDYSVSPGPLTLNFEFLSSDLNLDHGLDTLWGQGGKSLPLSEFSIFGPIWV